MKPFSCCVVCEGEHTHAHTPLVFAFFTSPQTPVLLVVLASAHSRSLSLSPYSCRARHSQRFSVLHFTYTASDSFSPFPFTQSVFQLNSFVACDCVCVYSNVRPPSSHLHRFDCFFFPPSSSLFRLGEAAPPFLNLCTCSFTCLPAFLLLFLPPSLSLFLSSRSFTSRAESYSLTIQDTLPQSIYIYKYTHTQLSPQSSLYTYFHSH